jgi:hypothetical protein
MAFPYNYQGFSGNLRKLWDMKTKLYQIVDSEGRVRYVGCSKQPKRRWKLHRKAARTGKGRHGQTPFAQWLRIELAAGRMPTLRVVCDGGPSEEREMIVALHSAGEPLMNVQGIVTAGRWMSLPRPARPRKAMQPERRIEDPYAPGGRLHWIALSRRRDVACVE